jgi:DNA-binding NarL/FixJ family response regulator
VTRGANVSRPPTVLSLEERKSVAKTVMPIVRVLVVFSQESSAEVVQEALSFEAHGYVLKIRTGIDLLIAVETVLRGMKFVST